MAFTLIDEKEPFWYDVEVPVVDSRGVPKKHKIKLKFRRADRDELEDIANRARERREGDESQGQENDVDYLMDIAVDWSEVSDKKGPMDFSRENVLRMVKHVPSLPLAVIKAWNEANYMGGVREKN